MGKTKQKNFFCSSSKAKKLCFDHENAQNCPVNNKMFICDHGKLKYRIQPRKQNSQNGIDQKFMAILPENLWQEAIKWVSQIQIKSDKLK